MQLLKMKIHEYDVSNGSLIVSFSTDESLGTPDNYTRLAFQPNIYAEFASVEEEINKIAQRGKYIAEDQDQKEKLNIDQNKINYYSSLVGQTLVFNLSNGIVDTGLSDLTTIVAPD